MILFRAGYEIIFLYMAKNAKSKKREQKPFNIRNEIYRHHLHRAPSTGSETENPLNTHTPLIGGIRGDVEGGGLLEEKKE